MTARPLRVLYLCDGFTDIRFVVGLAEACDLTLATPTMEFRTSGLAERLLQSGTRVCVDEIQGRRPVFQMTSFAYLLRNARRFDVVLAQGMGRGAVNATIAGRLLGVPVVTYESIAAVPYWRARRERGAVGPLTAAAGEAFIRACQTISGRLATTSIGLGPYLTEIIGQLSSNVEMGYYYGVDTDLFTPVDAARRLALRRLHVLPERTFLILFSSRISHEKDPETALKAVARARARGLDATVLNLGGGHRDFVVLAEKLGLNDPHEWVFGRPAVHPMKDLCDYFQTADLVVQSSLEEGLGLSPLEALACGTPVVATDVGGLTQLRGVARLTPRGDVEAMVDAILWVSNNIDVARRQALRGRDFVEMTWRKERAFTELMRVLGDATRRSVATIPHKECSEGALRSRE
ncbi:MAG: glycosyltransferase [Acidobacteria bacterium]|nr:MAG: glycosyltransferase [Acidobacteriota bacterium]